jgi:1-pyrroline-5-carboxylate dehydrogenase
MSEKLKITYATLATDNETLQTAMDQAIATVRQTWLGAEVPMFISGEKRLAAEKLARYSPINTNLLLCMAQSGTVADVAAGLAAAKAAREVWRHTPWPERVAMLRAVAEKISQNVFELSALLIFEVGKNRLEALGEVEETADLLRYYADSMERNRGFINEMGKLNPNDPTERNLSVLRPHGVWVVISPFNFPMALLAAPVAAALVTGNTVVCKGSPETPYTSWKVAELFAEAGLPPGVFNSLHGLDQIVGQALLDNPDVDGWTFTGSYDVGMKVLQSARTGPYPRPAIVEMGGKNPTIVSQTANLDHAAQGVMRAAFGMDGQKCSACSRVYVQAAVYDAFKEKLVALTEAVKIDDPTRRDAFMGTVIDQVAYERYQSSVVAGRAAGQVITGGHVLTEEDLSQGYFVEPTVIEGLPEDHEIVRTELFAPILVLAKVTSLEEAMVKANDTPYGLTAGFFGEDEAEIAWFLDNIQAGTTYINRASGATTGAWPGVQAFGGWKGSGSSGKGIGALYTLPLYMREQSRTIIG